MATPGPMISERPYTSQYCTPLAANLVARRFAARLSAKDDAGELEFVHAHAHFRNGIGDEQRIRRRRAQNGDTEIFSFI